MAIESKRVTAILLAAGRSERFGKDKLAESLAGQPLAHHAARALSAIDFARRIVVVGGSSVDIRKFGFDIVRSPEGSPISASIAAGVREAADTDCDACLIALADMPLIPEGHFRALMRAHQGDATVTGAGDRKMVPALFGRTMFSLLCQLRGDQGASKYLGGSNAVPVDLSSVFDIDVPSDLEMAHLLR